MALGVLIFGIIAAALLSIGFKAERGEGLGQILIFLVPVFGAAGIVFNRTTYQKQLQGCRTKPGIAEKLEAYRSVLIIRFARVEGPAFFAIIACLLTGNFLFMFIAGLLLLELWTYRPAIDKAGIDLELGPREKQALNESDGVMN